MFLSPKGTYTEGNDDRRARGAEAAYRRGLAITERLATGDRSNAVWRRDVVVSHWCIGNAHERAGNPQALEWWRKTYALLSAMKRDGIQLSAEDEDTLVELRHKIGA